MDRASVLGKKPDVKGCALCVRSLWVQAVNLGVLGASLQLADLSAGCVDALTQGQVFQLCA